MTIAMANCPYGTNLNNIHPEDTRFAILMEKLENAPKTVKNILSMFDYRSDTNIGTSILQWMVDNGRMTIEEFDQIMIEYTEHKTDD